MQRRLMTALLVVCLANCLEAAEPKRSFIAADSSKNRIAIIDEDGETVWEERIGPLHDLHVLPNGNLLFQRSWTHVVEVTPDTADSGKGKVVWEYEATKSAGNDGLRIEIHAFQRLRDGRTMIAESGRSRIIEVDEYGKIVKEFKLKVHEPHPHRDTRLARKLENGHYLVCHEGDSRVREYDKDGAVVWEYEVPLFGKKPRPGHGLEAFGNKCFSALRLPNGNTLIGTGNGHSVIEVTPEKKVVWSLHQDDLPGIRFAWITTLQVLPSGNIVIGNCHAGPDNPQLVEVTRDKQVVWKFHDFERFGNSLTNSQVLSVDGTSVP